MKNFRSIILFILLIFIVFEISALDQVKNKCFQVFPDYRKEQVASGDYKIELWNTSMYNLDQFKSCNLDYCFQVHDDKKPGDLMNGSIENNVQVKTGITLPLWISENMIMPAGISRSIQGTCKPFGEVSASFDSVHISAKANANGEWKMDFPEISPGIKGELVFTCGDQKKIIRDVVSGYIWLCAGQSNMHRPLKYSDESSQAERDIQTSDVRYFNGEGWCKVTKENVNNISAVGVWFSIKMANSQDVPIGIFVAARGGTGIEAWVPEDAFPANETGRKFRKLVDDPAVLKAAQEDKEDMKPYGQHRLAKWELGRAVPASLFNELIFPFGDLPVSGVLWYQGESNTDNRVQAKEYRYWLENLISSYREHFRNPGLPFVIIKLPFYDPGVPEQRTAWKIVQDIQADVAGYTYQTEVVDIKDLGDMNDIHPRKKKGVGVRAAKNALRLLGTDRD